MSALDDALSILSCFTQEEPSLSQADLARRTGSSKATASRVMKTLRESGILDYDAASRLYTPGIRLFELGQICRSNQNFLDMVISKLEDICRIGGHTAYVTVFDGQQLVVLRTIRGSSPLAISVGLGNRAWPHATSNGRAMLALLSEEEWNRRVPDALPSVTAKAPQSLEELKERVRLIQETGKSHSTDNSYEGVSSDGIAVRDPNTGEVIGIVVSYPTVLASPELEDRISSLLDRLKTDLLRSQ